VFFDGAGAWAIAAEVNKQATAIAVKILRMEILDLWSVLN